MNITKAKLESLAYYLSFNAPKLAGTPEFEASSQARMDAPVAWIDGTDYTKQEYKKLEKGAEVFEYMQQLLEENGYTIVKEEK